MQASLMLNYNGREVWAEVLAAAACTCQGFVFGSHMPEVGGVCSLGGGRGGAFLNSRVVGGPAHPRLREGGKKRKQENAGGPGGAHALSLIRPSPKGAQGRGPGGSMSRSDGRQARSVGSVQMWLGMIVPLLGWPERLENGYFWPIFAATRPAGSYNQVHSRTR